MSILKGILKESLGHYKNLKAKIHQRLKVLPSGSVYKRRIGGRTYYYLSLRNGSQVHAKYLGKERPTKIEQAVRERRLLLKQLKDINQSLRIIAKTQRNKSRD